MKNAILIPTTNSINEKEIELTARKKTDGWKLLLDKGKSYLSRAKKVVYLGKCEQDGDMFAVYQDDFIRIFRGHLNSGKY